MPKTIKCGIIGCGTIAPVHIESYLQQPDVNVAWVCDLIEEKAASLAEKYSIPNVTTDYHHMLADPLLDCVSVCTDHASHAPITVDVLSSGKHVICEKPLGISHTDLHCMLIAADANRSCAFGAVFQHRFDSSYSVLKRLISENAFGKVLTIAVKHCCLRKNEYYAKDAWRGKWETEGGAALINQSIHFLDILTWISGGVESVCAVYDNLTHDRSVLEAEDTVAAALRLRNGALATFAATTSSHSSWEAIITVHAAHGMIQLCNGNLDRLEIEDKEKEEEIKKEFASITEEKAVYIGKSYYGWSHIRQISDLIEAIRQKRAPFITGRSAAQSIEVALAIYESSRAKRRVDISHKNIAIKDKNRKEKTACI